MTAVREVQVTFDCADPAALSAFWAEALGYRPKAPDPGGKYIMFEERPGEPQVFVQKVAHDPRVHLDIESDDIEAEAIHKRMDLQVARLELQATAQSYRLEDATRIVTDIELVGTVEKEREREDDGIVSEISKTAGLEFTIPIFDSGQARLRKGELAYMRAANRLAELAVNVRSEARSAYLAYKSNYDIARHYRNNVLPLRNAIEEQSLLTYNGMITSTFELIADTREKIDSTILAVNANRDFWLAEANLAPVIYGGSTGSASAQTEVASAEEATRGGH